MRRHLAYLALSLLVMGRGECLGQTFQELHAFTCVWNDTNGWDCTSNGVGPQCALVEARDGNFYGTTTAGGRWGCGTVFKITPEGVFTTLAHFDWTNGCTPYGALLQASDANFYGTTLQGGTLFRFAPPGTITRLGYTASFPQGDLVQGPDGKLYGVCGDTGFYYDHGMVFSATTNGHFELLHLFRYGGDGGLYPSGGLLLASDGYFYGVTYLGGAEDTGTVYRIGTNGDFVTLASFHSGPGDARYPLGKLVQASDGCLYGAAGGFDSTIFKVTLDGTLTTFDRFNGWDGDLPAGGLIQATDGYIYGVTDEGGDVYTGNHGTVFRFPPGVGCTDHTWDPCGYLSLVANLGVRYYGSYNGGLVQGSDGNLYGTTDRGGMQGGGNVYRIIMPGNECRLTCPTNITVCNDPGQCGAVVQFAPPVSTNCNGYIITCEPHSGSFFPAGTNTVVCTAVDIPSGRLTNTCSFLVTVLDCEAPVIHSITATPASLWPPNHKMQTVTLHVSATDNCAGVHSRIISVTSNEPAASDRQITGDLTVNLRAERAGHGQDRVYTITAECADGSGNKSIAVVNVAVQK